jgi:hypothetical protein
MEKLQFTDKATTKEQYLKFKDFIKSEKYHVHRDYVAYYIFKHRLVGEERDKYLEDEVRHRCWKALYHGRIVYSGGDLTESYAIPRFKNLVIERYNKFAEDGEE